MNFRFFALCLIIAIYSFGQTQNPIDDANQSAKTIKELIKNNQYKEVMKLTWGNGDNQDNSQKTELQSVNYSYRVLSLKNNLCFKEFTVNGYESKTNIKFYCIGDREFYLEMYSSAEGCDDAFQVYYSPDMPDQIIKCLKQTNNCRGGTVGNTIELKNQDQRDEVRNMLIDFSMDIDKHTNDYYYTQVESSELYTLRKDIEQIHSFSSYLAFLAEHSPTFEDLDTLYTMLTKKPCPNGLTNSIVNGDSTIIASYPMDYLHFIFRNTIYQFDLNQYKAEQIRSIPVFISLHDNIVSYPEKVNLDLAEKTEKQFRDFAIEKYSLVPNKKEITVGSNFKSWFIYLHRNKLNYCRSNYASAPSLQFYIVNIYSDEDYESKNYEELDRINTKFETEFCTSNYSKNLYQYQKAQVFSDILFVKINNRWVFFDYSR